MFKVGDIIVCINDGSYKEKGYTMGDIGLTIGKNYEVARYLGKPFSNGAVNIINDRNESQNYQTYRFVTLAEYRKMKIKKLKYGIQCF